MNDEIKMGDIVFIKSLTKKGIVINKKDDEYIISVNDVESKFKRNDFEKVFHEPKKLSARMGSAPGLISNNTLFR